jgi:GNAT superfamily N-acetyltransferase
MEGEIIEYRKATDADLPLILKLQQANLAQNLTPEEASHEGFVSIQHSLELLAAMNQGHGHTVAFHRNTLVGYALVMAPSFSKAIHLLEPLFEKIDAGSYQNNPLAKTPYVIMGQVCIAKTYRGQGVFTGLYKNLNQRLAGHFKYLITEIHRTNERSIRAHKKYGFQTLGTTEPSQAEEWVTVIKELG